GRRLQSDAAGRRETERGCIKPPESPIRPRPQRKTTEHHANPRPTDGAFAHAANLKSVRYGSGDHDKNSKNERPADQPRTATIKLLGFETFCLLPLPHSSL